MVDDGEIKIIFSNVPPGKYAFYLQGEFFEKEGYSDPEAPVGYWEFTMPSKDHQMTAAIDGTDIHFELVGAVEPTDNIPESLFPIYPHVFLERIGPKSTGVHRIDRKDRMVEGNPESYIVPIYQREMWFQRYKDSESIYFPVVPVGRYQVTIYGVELTTREQWIVDQYEIEVKPGDSDKKFEIQCPLPPKGE